MKASRGVLGTFCALSIVGQVACSEEPQGPMPPPPAPPPAAVPPTYSITINLWDDLWIRQGESGEATVLIQRAGGFDGPVSLAATGLPPGVTASFDPVTTTGDVSAVTITLSRDVPIGTLSIPITGSAAGQLNQNATLTFSVVEFAARWTFCPPIGVPVWAAYQDGDGEWVRATQDGNSWVMNLDSDRGGIAWVTDVDGAPTVNVFYGLRDELWWHGRSLCWSREEPVTVTGRVTGIGPTDQVFVSLGPATAVVTSGTDPDFELDVDVGTYDLLAMHVIRDVSGDDPVLRTKKMIQRREVWVSAAQELPVLDFASGEAFEPVEHEVSINGADGDQTFVVTDYFLGGSIAPGHRGLPSPAATKTFATFPADRRSHRESYLLSAVALNDPVNPTSVRTVQEYFTEAGNRTLWLGPPLGEVTVSSIPGAPYPRLQISLRDAGLYGKAFSAGYSQAGRQWRFAASSALIGAGVTLTVPDFSGVEGWDPAAWALQAGVETEWFFTATHWALDGGQFEPPLYDGRRVVSATRQGTITP